MRAWFSVTPDPNARASLARVGEHMASVDIRADAGSDLADLGRDLQRAGAVRVKRELIKGFQRATKDVKTEVAASARATLPNGGGKGKGIGLGDWVATLGVKTDIRTSGRNVGVRITGSKSKGATDAHRQRLSKKNARSKRKTSKRKHASTLFGIGLADLNAINRGKVKAPTFGHRPWHLQTVKPGFFDDVMKGPVAEAAQRGCLDAIAAIRKEITGG